MDRTLTSTFRSLGEIARPALLPSRPNAADRTHSVLLVDDDPFARVVLADALEARGFVVRQVQSGREAVRALLEANDPYSLIMTDLVMPDMDGRTLLGLLKVASCAAAVPVVIVTASAASCDERELRHEGAEAVVDKGWGPGAIAEVAEAMLTVSGHVKGE